MIDLGPCLKYRGILNEHGYGVAQFGPKRWSADGVYRGRRQVLVHRHIMQRVVGRTLRRDEVVMHECDEPACIRFSHLRLATQRDNIADMDAKGRRRTRALRGSENHHAKLTESDVETIRGLRGIVPSRVLGERFGVTAGTIRSVWIGSWRHVEKGARPMTPGDLNQGENAGTSTLTQAQVDEIRRLYASGDHSQTEIARLFGINSATVSRIVRGKSWRRSWDGS